jgi:cbb3-type cytochrome oxidase maturation protein
MNIMVLMIPIALLLGVGFVAAFLWATSRGQFDDLETPAHRMLEDKNLRNDNERKNV